MTLVALARILLARQRNLLWGWSLGLFLYFLVIGAFYATVKGQPSYDELWESLSPTLRDAFGGSGSITEPGGYMETQGTSLLPLILGGVLLAQATRRLSGAEQTGELDLVLSLPVRRSTYLWSHWLSGVALAVSWTLAAAAGTVLGMALAGVSGMDLVRIAYMVVEVLPFALAVHAAAILAGAALHRRGPGLAAVSVLLATWYMLQLAGALSDETKWLRWLSPYALWLRGDPFQFQTDAWYLLACGLVMAVCLPWAARAWRTKDLKG